MRTTSGHTERCVFILILATLTAPLPVVGQEEAGSAATEATPLFETPHTRAELAGKQAVVDTDRGEFVIDLLPEAAPNHVGYFIKSAEEGVYDGTIFHRMVRHGVVQGGDPFTKDPEKPELYGQGGLGVLAAEISDEKHIRGAVSAAQIPGNPDSAGSQFFISVVDQPALDGSYTVFGRVSEGMNVVTEISEAQTDESGRTVDRIVIRSVTIRDQPAPQAAPFTGDSVEQLAGYRAILATTSGAITIQFMPEIAPEHVRNFLRLASLGVFDGMSFHRVVEECSSRPAGSAAASGRSTSASGATSPPSRRSSPTHRTSAASSPWPMVRIRPARTPRSSSAPTPSAGLTASTPSSAASWTACRPSMRSHCFRATARRQHSGWRSWACRSCGRCSTRADPLFDLPRPLRPKIPAR